MTTQKAAIAAVRDTAEAMGFPPLSPAAVDRLLTELRHRGYRLEPNVEREPEEGLDVMFSLRQIIHHAQAARRAIHDEQEGTLRAAVSEMHDMTHHLYRMVMEW